MWQKKESELGITSAEHVFLPQTCKTYLLMSPCDKRPNMQAPLSKDSMQKPVERQCETHCVQHCSKKNQKSTSCSRLQTYRHIWVSEFCYCRQLRSPAEGSELRRALRWLAPPHGCHRRRWWCRHAAAHPPGEHCPEVSLVPFADVSFGSDNDPLKPESDTLHLKMQILKMHSGQLYRNVLELYNWNSLDSWTEPTKLWIRGSLKTIFLLFFFFTLEFLAYAFYLLFVRLTFPPHIHLFPLSALSCFLS